ncbi:MAG: hypothetical protein KAJ75_03210 [Alphaproteobacteria bacterium]|nr:hypothetical protein [Alphaproteobacteria bacterium]
MYKPNKTALIVGQNFSDVDFLNHLKKIYSPRGGNVHVTIKTARGCDSIKAIDFTIRQLKISTYNTKAILLDGEKLTKESKEKARTNKIKLIVLGLKLENLLTKKLLEEKRQEKGFESLNRLIKCFEK